MSEYFLGLLGHPISHSLSPILHKAALQFAGLQGDYFLFDIPPQRLEADLKSIIDSGLSGFNITVPYKQDIYNLCLSKTEEANLSGAVNTVKVEKDGKLTGHNTDIIGFKLAFSEAFAVSLKNKTALVIGAGGAAKAVVVALSQMGLAKVKIKARDPQKVNLFISQMQTNLATLKNNNSYSTILSADDIYTEKISCVINASSIGLSNEPMPIWLAELINKLPSDCLCFDLVYKKDGSKPAFAQLAIAKELNTTDGLTMLIHQAKHAFKYWTDIDVPVELLHKALLNSITDQPNCTYGT